MKNLLVAATELLELQVVMGDSIRELSKKQNGQFVDTQMLVAGSIGSVITGRDRERAKIVGVSQRRSVLIAAFKQGINVVESSISKGYYIQAAALEETKAWRRSIGAPGWSRT